MQIDIGEVVIDAVHQHNGRRSSGVGGREEGGVAGEEGRRRRRRWKRKSHSAQSALS